MHCLQEFGLNKLPVPQDRMLSFPALSEEFLKTVQTLTRSQLSFVKHIGCNAGPTKSALAGAFSDAAAQPECIEVRTADLLLQVAVKERL